MTLPSKYTDPILRITLTLAQYPILSDRIRDEMRAEIFERGIISQEDFETVVRKQSIRSQRREGLEDPLAEEDAEVWETRQQRVRDHLTDFYWATNLPYELFEDIIRGTLLKRKREDEISIYFNPELAPKYVLFEQARLIEKMPPDERAKNEARLEEIKVVLIRAMISDQLAYVGIAKNWFSISDLSRILRRKIGYGKIGGKSAGMLLAASILRSIGDPEIKASIKVPDSYFVGADLMYTFMRINGLMHWNDQKYKSEEEIRQEYPLLKEEYLQGIFPDDIIARFTELVEDLKGQPLIVRSSSLLEDNFGFSFAGKYDSFFCPNQGSTQENLEALVLAIKNIYSSTVNPDALLYRRKMGLQDYDERMAILIQVVEGEKSDEYFLPHGAGVAFSRNLYRWSPQIRREDGFLRLVWGLGTRAVDRVGNDYPRLVALSHPSLRPEAAPETIQRYSQQYVDVINLDKNHFETIPIHTVLTPRYKTLRFIAQIFQDNYLSSIRSILMPGQTQNLVLTMDGLLTRTQFPERMRKILHSIQEAYERPIDMEFTVQIQEPNSINPEVTISILQCRPQSHVQNIEARLPENLAEESIVFSTRRMVPQGFISNIEYIIYVPAEIYFSLSPPSKRTKLAKAIGQINNLLEEKTFICIGPGRWGTTNPDLGVTVSYSDVYNARALVEITGVGIGTAPEPSFGTHFFQDLMEANTYPLAVFLEDEDVHFNQSFLDKAPNVINKFLSPQQLNTNPFLNTAIHVIEIKSYKPNTILNIVMDGEQNKAVAFLKKEDL